MMIVSSAWGIFLVEDLIKIPAGTTSGYKIVNFFIKLFSCPLCTGAHFFWIWYLVSFGSFYGILICPVVFYLTFLIKKYIIKWN